MSPSVLFDRVSYNTNNLSLFNGFADVDFIFITVCSRLCQHLYFAMWSRFRWHACHFVTHGHTYVQLEIWWYSIVFVALLGSVNRFVFWSSAKVWNWTQQWHVSKMKFPFNKFTMIKVLVDREIVLSRIVRNFPLHNLNIFMSIVKIFVYIFVILLVWYVYQYLFLYLYLRLVFVYGVFWIFCLCRIIIKTFVFLFKSVISQTWDTQDLSKKLRRQFRKKWSIMCNKMLQLSL